MKGLRERYVLKSVLSKTAFIAVVKIFVKFAKMIICLIIIIKSAN